MPCTERRYSTETETSIYHQLQTYYLLRLMSVFGPPQTGIRGNPVMNALHSEVWIRALIKSLRCVLKKDTQSLNCLSASPEYYIQKVRFEINIIGITVLLIIEMRTSD